MKKFMLFLILPTLLCISQLVLQAGTEHKLSRGDRIKINVLDEPEITKETIVGEDGYISLALIDRIKLEGMTCSEAA
ncbi:MAG: polysaccharide biosynthesis/export family protein, partial [Armatimonadota bacterium]|nr:polysaccharide biosynthesis/export family protein [Armatimonadota bacterium]